MASELRVGGLLQAVHIYKTEANASVRNMQGCRSTNTQKNDKETKRANGGFVFELPGNPLCPLTSPAFYLHPKPTN